MSVIHVNQIKAHLTSLFHEQIDMTDCTEKSAKDYESIFLSRSLAAFVIHIDANVEPIQAAASVTDGFHDNGLDAIFFHESKKTLYLVQSKWRHDGAGSIERGDAQKFIQGVKDLITIKLDRFNKKVNKHQKEIETALADANTRIILVLAYTGQSNLSEEILRDLNDFLYDMNDSADVMELRTFKQSQLHHIIATGALGAPINFEIVLRDWGYMEEPFPAYYGRISASEIANWYTYHSKLFAPNIRSFLADSNINQDITQTLSKEPENFWYFNNGITALCSAIKKKPLGGPSRDSGVFECTDVSIVNGAQTVGAIAKANDKDPTSVARASVMVRFISLEGCPTDFSVRVTRATNTQNRIEKRDFVSLDTQQERLRTELQLEGITYVYKSGYSIDEPSKGFDLTEATVVLASAHSELSYAMQAKKGIGVLWEDVTKAPYRALFNPNVSSTRLWRLVQMHRAVDIELKNQQGSYHGRDAMLPVHGNRFLARQVFRHLDLSGLDDPNLDINEILKAIPNITAKAVELAIKAVNEKYSESYLANIFKNNNKCSCIEAYIDQLW